MLREILGAAMGKQNRDRYHDETGSSKIILIKQEGSMRIFICFVLFASIALVSVAQNKKWEQEPTAWRGVAFGASEHEAQTKITNVMECNPSLGGRVCTTTHSIAEDLAVK